MLYNIADYEIRRWRWEWDRRPTGRVLPFPTQQQPLFSDQLAAILIDAA